jgi:hypothetical protein
MGKRNLQSGAFLALTTRLVEYCKPVTKSEQDLLAQSANCQFAAEVNTSPISFLTHHTTLEAFARVLFTA